LNNRELGEDENMRFTSKLIGIVATFVFSNAAVAGFPAQKETVSSASAESSAIKIAHPEVPRIAARDVKQMIARNADVVIVDTQPAENYEMWHIPTAVNIPYISTGNPTDREMMLVALPMEKLIVIYCLCEEGTDSAQMALELKRLGYDHDKVKVLEGGLIKWDEQGYPMIKAETPQ
jgi:rhodanese-related sulfurtransferase